MKPFKQPVSSIVIWNMSVAFCCESASISASFTHSLRNRKISNNVDFIHGLVNYGGCGRERQRQLYHAKCKMWLESDHITARHFIVGVISRHRCNIIFLGFFGRYVGSKKGLVDRCVHWIFLFNRISICHRLLYISYISIFSWCNVSTILLDPQIKDGSKFNVFFQKTNLQVGWFTSGCIFVC